MMIIAILVNIKDINNLYFKKNFSERLYASKYINNNIIIEIMLESNVAKYVMVCLPANTKRYIDKKQYIWLILIFIIEIFVLLSTRLSHY